MKISSFDRWVNDNNIPRSFEYSKGWWDYVELIRRFAFKTNAHDVRVIGHYHVHTPPPCEQLPMPAVAIDADGVTFALRYDFGSFSLSHDQREWALSVERRSRYTGPLFGLIRPTEDLRNVGLDGLNRDHLFGPYAENQARFTASLEDEWDVAALMQILTHEC